jgi:hypothetical protein
VPGACVLTLRSGQVGLRPLNYTVGPLCGIPHAGFTQLNLHATSTKKYFTVTEFFVTIVGFYVPLDKILKKDIIRKI